MTFNSLEEAFATGGEPVLLLRRRRTGLVKGRRARRIPSRPLAWLRYREAQLTLRRALADPAFREAMDAFVLALIDTQQKGSLS